MDPCSFFSASKWEEASNAEKKGIVKAVFDREKWKSASTYTVFGKLSESLEMYPLAIEAYRSAKDIADRKDSDVSAGVKWQIESVFGKKGESLRRLERGRVNKFDKWRCLDFRERY